MLEVSGGSSEKDRVSFYTSNNCATAIRNQNGEITLEFVRKNISWREEIIFFLGVFGTPSLVKEFVLIPLIENEIVGIVWYLIPTFYYLVLTVMAIIGVRKTKGKELLKNHGTEHKVFSAYMKLKRIPTVEEANQFSRINKTCGATIFSAFMTSQIIGFVVYIVASYKIPEIILFLIPFLFNSIFPFNFIGKVAQFFTTSKPQRQNLELAIAALSALERKELLGDVQLDDFHSTLKN